MLVSYVRSRLARRIRFSFYASYIRYAVRIMVVGSKFFAKTTATTSLQPSLFTCPPPMPQRPSHRAPVESYAPGRQAPTKASSRQQGQITFTPSFMDMVPTHIHAIPCSLSVVLLQPYGAQHSSRRKTKRASCAHLGHSVTPHELG
jgi:hypothetical protein